jgi:ribosomal protein L11 methyltransferase
MRSKTRWGDMEWIEISITADGEAAEAVSELFNRLNSRPDGQGGAVTEVAGFDEIGDDHRTFVTVKTYVPEGDEAAAQQRELELGLWFLGRIYPMGEPVIRRMAEVDWANAWKSSYHTLRVGKRFVIVPAWERESQQLASGDLPIILDPGMAFGTGLHPSTQLCLVAMETVVQPGLRVLDAGCGSGILSIAAARLGAEWIDAFDIDPIAVRATEENATLNELPLPIHAVVSEGPNPAEALWGSGQLGRPTWDVILVNILPHVIEVLLDRGLAQHLAPEGRMIFAGIIEERETDVRGALARHGFRVSERFLQGDWVGLVGARDRER